MRREMEKSRTTLRLFFLSSLWVIPAKTYEALHPPDKNLQLQSGGGVGGEREIREKWHLETKIFIANI